ncbi:hypothetical protein [Streptomyces rhizosphaerihabitans]|uniref:hypothetical protein n=1 Tax=Streptomyces rhizosphaerihabitans TaxID=1266770 RepID=UPI0021BF760B|nr:hypothetical protein [Streptomyces rhizosphaerihabitans]MCT9011599.1 hypothetical protein [Streptomyces rhizosphaerihabitans]
MAAADPEHVAWLTERKLARAWPAIRPTCLHATANANKVRNNFRVSHSTWGESMWRTYHPADVARVAGAIADGTAALQPHWRNDTPEAKLLDQRLRRKNLPGAIGCALLIAVALAIIVTIVVVVISWNDSPSSYSPPSYWH